MGFESVSFCNFRNLKDGEVRFNSREIHLIGNNGQGKTNFLEALYLLSYGSSFRTRSDKNFVAWGYKDMSLTGAIDIQEEPKGKIVFSVKDGVKSIKLYDKIIYDRKELLRRIPAIVFIHDDYLLADGSPEKRRWFMDQTLSLYDILYIDQLRKYKKLLKERNFLLKNKKLDLIDHYTEQLVLTGLAIVEYRKSLTKNFGNMFTALYWDVSKLNSQVHLVYKPSWGECTNSEDIIKRFHEKLNLDLTQGSTSIGPHRDRYVFIADNREFSSNASTGQKRLLSLVLRVAQAQFYYKITNRKPLLLLDDVLLELDPGRQQLFCERLPEAEQIFYTFLPKENMISSENDSQTFEVVDGEFYERR